MGVLRCVDGSVLTVLAVPCRDRAGQPYEITLEMFRNQQLFAAVGERCGHQLARLAADLGAARDDPQQAAAWPDPADRFPCPPGARPGLPDTLPSEREYFALRSRDRGDLPGAGELRCTVRLAAQWPRRPGGGRPPAGGGWQLTRRAVVEAWGSSGIGVRAVLTSAELMGFLDTVLSEPDGAVLAATGSGGPSTAGKQPGSASLPSRRQQGRGPDGTARSCLPDLRPKARSVALAGGDPSARGGDVRR